MTEHDSPRTVNRRTAVRLAGAGVAAGLAASAAGATAGAQAGATPARTARPAALPARFDGRISAAQLDYYLSRTMTFQGLLASSPEPASDTFADDLRMLGATGARLIGQAAYAWTPPADDEAHFAQATDRATRVHELDPTIMLQAAVYETAYTSVGEIPVPAWVFTEFDLPVQDRTFDYAAMLFPDGSLVDQWGPGASVPDIRQQETQLWYFYRSRRYLDAGCEVIHYGQVELIGSQDDRHVAFADLLARVRRYAVAHARRGIVLASGHTYGIRRGERLLLDYHAYPVRPDEVVGAPEHAELRLDQQMGNLNGIYRKSLGGITPSGWRTAALAYSVDLDNFGGAGPEPGVADLTQIWTWGYDEIAWFARQPADYRDQWLGYAFDWIRANDPVGWLAMPGRRTLGAAPTTIGVPVPIADGRIDAVTASTYKVNTPSAGSPIGFGQEARIAEIWSAAGATPALVRE